MSGLLPGRIFPTIDLPRVGGGRIDNTIFAEADRMTVLNVYRGLHCPRCRRQMADFIANRIGCGRRLDFWRVRAQKQNRYALLSCVRLKMAK